MLHQQVDFSSVPLSWTDLLRNKRAVCGSWKQMRVAFHVQLEELAQFFLLTTGRA